MTEADSPAPDKRKKRLLPSPGNVALPFFAYGSLKPGELAFSQIERFLEGKPVPAELRGALKVRDGLPLLADGGAKVSGYLLYFKTGDQFAAYSKISEFEPREIYRWAARPCLDQDVKANVLLGKVPNSGGAEDIDGKAWSFRLDPVFRYGLSVIRDSVSDFGAEEFRSAPADSFDWPRFFHLQMAYLLLWSAIERFTALAYGPALEPMQRVRLLGCDPLFAAALKHRIAGSGERVSDSRDPKTSYRLDPTNPGECADYYYQVRSNLSHRGKAAFRDGNLVRNSLIALLAIVEEMLAGIEKYGN